MTQDELRGMAGRSLIIIILLGFSLCPMVAGHPEWALPLVILAMIIASASFIVEFAKVLEMDDGNG